MLRNLKPARESMPPHLYEKLVRAFEERRARADREEFLRILNREGGAEPEPEPDYELPVRRLRTRVSWPLPGARGPCFGRLRRRATVLT